MTMERSITCSRQNDGALRVVFLLLGAITLLLGLSACEPGGATSPPAGNGNGPKLSFKETEHDFGAINYSKAMEYGWEFTNAGNAPLQINDVRAEPLDPTS